MRTTVHAYGSPANQLLRIRVLRTWLVGMCEASDGWWVSSSTRVGVQFHYSSTTRSRRTSMHSKPGRFRFALWIVLSLFYATAAYGAPAASPSAMTEAQQLDRAIAMLNGWRGR